MPYSARVKTLLRLYILCFAAPVFAADDGVQVIFGGSQDYAPHHFSDTDGRASGFDVELVSAIAETRGWNVRYRLDDWDVIQRDLAAGDIDLVPMFVSESRQRQFLFSDPVLIENHFLYGTAATDSLSNIADLAGHTVAAEVEAYALQELRSMGIGAILVPARNEAEALRMAARGEVDYAISPRITAEYIINRDNLPVVRHSPPLLPVSYAFAINRQRPDLVTLVNKTLTDLNRTGYITKQSEQWLEQAGAASNPAVYWLSIPLALAVTLFLFGAYYYRRRLYETRARLRRQTRELREARIRELSSSRTDSLTGLNTRNYFLQQTGKFIEEARGGDCHLAVGVFRFRDLDLIEVGGEYGAADRYVRQIADKLIEQNRCISGYFGQGEFSLLFEHPVNLEHAVREFSAIMDALTREVPLNDAELRAQIHAGLVLDGDNQDDEYELLRKAHIALKSAESRNLGLAVYDHSLDLEAFGMGLLKDLKNALINDQFSWAYQPQLHVDNREIRSAEMLIRWQHPHHGWIPPMQFITQAEQSGLINLVTRAVVTRAVTTIRTWRREGNPCNLSINISANDLADNDNVDYLIASFSELGEFLTLEITETAIMKDVDSIIDNVSRLRKLGIKLALDDYGTGYSSLEYLKRFQFDELKIDKIFIDNITTSERDLKLTKASIELGHVLGANVVAEGVEDEETARLLIGLNCNILQGYGISRPVPIDEFNRFKQAYTCNLAF